MASGDELGTKRLRDVLINTDAIRCVRGTPKRATKYKGPCWEEPASTGPNGISALSKPDTYDSGIPTEVRSPRWS